MKESSKSVTRSPQHFVIVFTSVKMTRKDNLNNYSHISSVAYTFFRSLLKIQ